MREFSKRKLATYICAGLTFSVAGSASAQVWRMESWEGYGGNAQHTATSSDLTSEPMNRILWTTPVDTNPQYSGSELFIHYAPPMVTYGGLVLVTVKTGAYSNFEVQARNELTGKLLWTQTTDYVLPGSGWVPTCGSSLDGLNGMVTPGIGGTVYLRSRTDLVNSSITQLAFYGINSYNTNKATYNNNIKINTPLTVDNAGNIFFGFEVDGATPTNLQGGLAKISPNGTGTWISGATATGDASIVGSCLNCAPAISNDGKTVYIAMNRGGGSGGYLVGVDVATMKAKYSVHLLDPRSQQEASLQDLSTATPMVGPDGDVFYGVFENPFYNDRGWMLHFDTTLTETKTPGSFGWDNTASVVPAGCVPSYKGKSKYLILTKYNNYVGYGPLGTGVNKVAVLDPNNGTPDPINGFDGNGNAVNAMTPIIFVVGPTPDQNANLTQFPNAVHEWCINSAAIDVKGRCAIINSEDGRCYRWDFVTNKLVQTLTLSGGLGEAYTSTVIGKYGICFAINNAQLCAVGR